MTIVTQDLEIADSTPHHQVERHQRQTTQTNTARRLIVGSGSNQPPSPPESPPDSPRPSNSGSSSSSQGSPMAGNVGGGGNPPPPPPNPQLPWLRAVAVAVPGVQHPLPKHSDKILPMFNPDDKEPAEVHIDKFMLAVQTLNVQHEDVVCRLFPVTFEGKASTWYFSLVQGSITNWEEFNKAFLDKFGEDKTPALLSLELSRIKMEPKERIKDF